MAKRTKRSRLNWRTILNIITLAALIVLIVLLRTQIISTFRNLHRLNAWYLLLMLPLQFIDYDAYGRMYQVIFGYLGHKTKYWEMYRVTLELNLVNHVFPSGGVSGFSYFGLRLRKFGIGPGKATLVQLLKFILIFLSFQILIVIGVFALAIGGKASDLMILVAGSLATLTVAATVVLAYVIGSKKRINTFVTFFTDFINSVIKVIWRKHRTDVIRTDKVKNILEEMHDTYVLIKGDRRVVRKAFLYALIANISEVATVYVVYLAFGSVVNVGAIIIAYAIANFAGLISVMPGGIGVYEGLMTAMLATAGIPPGLSLPATATYRILTMVAQLIPGWALYHQAVNEMGQQNGA